eukprot:UN01061
MLVRITSETFLAGTTFKLHSKAKQNFIVFFVLPTSRRCVGEKESCFVIFESPQKTSKLLRKSLFKQFQLQSLELCKPRN